MKGVLFMSNTRNRIRRAFVRHVDRQIEFLSKVNQNLQKQDKKQRLQQIVQSILDQNVATFNQSNNSNEK
jgi:DNA-binding transcriptional regulator GbsR (MarR family)